MVRVSHGYWARWPVGTPPSDLSHWERAALLQPLLGRDFRVSHLSAGHLWGFPLSPHLAWIHDLLDEVPLAPRHDERPHLSRAHCRPSQSARGHVLHRGLGLPPVEGLWGAQVTSALETLLALQDILPGWRGVAAIDFLLAHGTSMTPRSPMSVVELERELDALPPHVRGAQSVRRGLSLAAERTWSPMETVLRLVVQHWGFPLPVPNVHVMLPGQGSAYVDLAWPEVKVGLEYNGRGHYLDPGYAEEMHRLNQLQEAGWRIRNVLLNDLKLPDRLYSLHQWLTRTFQGL